MGVIGILPGDTGLWHGSRRARVYDCVMGLWVKVPLIRAAYSGSRAYCPRGHAKKIVCFQAAEGLNPRHWCLLIPSSSKFQAGGSFARRRVKVSLDYYFNFTYIGLRSNPNGEITHAHRGRPRPTLQEASATLLKGFDPLLQAQFGLSSAASARSILHDALVAARVMRLSLQCQGSA
jgi:hypothetical protein